MNKFLKVVAVTGASLMLVTGTALACDDGQCGQGDDSWFQYDISNESEAFGNSTSYVASGGMADLNFDFKQRGTVGMKNAWMSESEGTGTQEAGGFGRGSGIIRGNDCFFGCKDE